MSQIVILVFGSAVEPQEFHDMVLGMGGETDPRIAASVRLSQGSSHVWVYGPEGESIGDDPEVEATYEQVLGGPVAADVTLHLSRSAHSPRLAMDIVEAAAQRWRLAVDNTEDEVLTVDQLRDRARNYSSVFWEAPWDWA